MVKTKKLERLPDTIPLFPLPGALLLPSSKLPLNLFEPKYLQMLDDVLKTPERLIGMIQTTENKSKSEDKNLGLHKVGCAGRVINFTETDDGDEDPNLFFGIDIELNPEFSVLMEYNAALNENNMTTETLAISRGGYLNAAIRWTFVEHLHLELNFNNLLFDEDKVDYFKREIKIIYIEYF